MTRDEIEKMPRKALNAEAWHLIQEQEEYERELADLRRQLEEKGKLLAAEAMLQARLQQAAKMEIEDLRRKLETERDQYRYEWTAAIGQRDKAQDERDEAKETVTVLERALALVLDDADYNPGMANYFIQQAEGQLGAKPLIIDAIRNREGGVK